MRVHITNVHLPSAIGDTTDELGDMRRLIESKILATGEETSGASWATTHRRGDATTTIGAALRRHVGAKHDQQRRRAVDKDDDGIDRRDTADNASNTPRRTSQHHTARTTDNNLTGRRTTTQTDDEYTTVIKNMLQGLNMVATNTHEKWRKHVGLDDPHTEGDDESTHYIPNTP